MALNVGLFRYRVEIQENQGTQDEYANDTENWQTIHTVWADIEPVSGREYFSIGQNTSEVTVKIYVRYLSDLTAKMRVKYGSHIYGIEDVLGDKRTGFMTIMAKEGY